VTKATTGTTSPHSGPITAFHVSEGEDAERGGRCGAAGPSVATLPPIRV